MGVSSALTCLRWLTISEPDGSSCDVSVSLSRSRSDDSAQLCQNVTEITQLFKYLKLCTYRGSYNSTQRAEMFAHAQTH